jgi:hypothetical protein
MIASGHGGSSTPKVVLIRRGPLGIIIAALGGVNQPAIPVSSIFAAVPILT